MKIPTTIVTGFLGAGKTSLIASLLKQSDLRLALLINEFGSVGMDGAILADEEGCACPMIELANGCICCTIADDFVPAMESLASLEQPPHHVVIETSGLALPQPLVKAFDWHGVRTRFYVQGVVTVLDCDQLAHESQAQLNQQAGIINHDKGMDELLTEQLHHADIILMNKADCVTEAERDAIRERVRPFHHAAVRVHETHHGKFPMSLLLDETAHRVHDDDHHHDDHHHDDHDHDDFSSVSLRGGVFASQDELEQAVMNCMARHSLYRLKGMVTIAGKSLPMVVQAVGKRVHCYHARGHRNDGSSVVVAIGGRALDGDAIGHTLGHDFKPCTS